jgi:hypothetical protein
MKFKVNFTNNISIIYDLVDADIVKNWAELIKQKTISDCCKINHYIGYSDETVINSHINRLYVLSDLINQCIPDKVIKKEITKETWKEALQVMHVHFPEYRNDENYKDIWDNLSEYNDIIHWLESILLPRSLLKRWRVAELSCQLAAFSEYGLMVIDAELTQYNYSFLNYIVGTEFIILY